MKRTEFPGGWYADARPNGAYVVLHHPQGQGDNKTKTIGKLETRLPGMPALQLNQHLTPLFPRLNSTGTKFAGQSWEGYKTLEYVHDGFVWSVNEISTVAVGTSAVIYDANDSLIISDGHEVGSQGYRYVDFYTGEIVSGDVTYQPTQDAPKLFEWTNLGDGLVVGQGPVGGVLLWDGTRHRIIEDPNRGLCRFVRAHRVGNDVSIAWWGYSGAVTTCLWTTMDELRSLGGSPSPLKNSGDGDSSSRDSGQSVLSVGVPCTPASDNGDIAVAGDSFSGSSTSDAASSSTNLNAPPNTKGKNKFAFRDIRNTAELLASARPPKSLKMKFINPVSKKLSKFKNKITALKAKFDEQKAKVNVQIPDSLKPAASAATNVALGVAAQAFTAKLAGKVNLPGGENLGGAISKISSAASAISLGVNIIQEMDPKKIRRPLKEGLSASASAMAEPLAKTAAASIATSLVTGASLASGLPTIPRQFKTAASLIKSPRFFNPKNMSFAVPEVDKVAAEKAIVLVTISTAQARLYPQRGLLEDELMYRLTLLAENVYAPTNKYAQSRGWGSLTILEGFRAENSGTSQHEMGEAIDITLGDSQKCYELAIWMRDHILYDQLILCFDVSGGGQVWIHASFRPTARRRQVLTKAFNDTHIDGLHHYRYSTATGSQVALEKKGEAFGNMLADRQARLQPVGLDTVLPQRSGLNDSSTTTPPRTTPPPDPGEPGAGPGPPPSQ